MSTFIVSAFWHGFYPFYYVMFFFAAVLQEVSKDLYKARYLFRVIPERLRPIIGNLVTMLVLNYNGVMFNALTFENGIKFGNRTYWFVFVIITVVLIFSRTFGLVKFVQKLEKRHAEAAAKKADPRVREEPLIRELDKP
jgi:lysophospholipid acyltransferase